MSTNKKTLVLYVFHIVNDRVTYFLKNCIFESDSVDFVVISNSRENKFECPSYVKKVIMRENKGYDFGGWSDALLLDNLYSNYQNFIFVNSSVIGPFLPHYYTGKWTDCYLNGLKDNVKLFGSTINNMHNPRRDAHVQSYIFSMNRTTLEYLINCRIFSLYNYAATFEKTIYEKEVLMSRKIIENGWNIGSLLTRYDGVDFTFSTKTPKSYNILFLGDIMWDGQRGNLWSEYEVIFIKGNRIPNVYPESIQSI